MNYKIIIIDINQNNINIFKNRFSNIRNIECVYGDVIQYKDQDNVAFVSPTDSLGIDRTYSKDMFPDLERLVMDKYAEHGKNVINIGSAITVKINNELNQYLISAPTMFLPGNVSNTNNALRAFYATLCAIDKSGIKVDTIIVPPFCTGVGMMDPTVAADQMFNALIHFLKIGRARDSSNDSNAFLL